MVNFDSKLCMEQLLRSLAYQKLLTTFMDDYDKSKLIDCGMDAEGEVVYIYIYIYISSTRDEKCDLIRKKYDNLYTFYKDIFEESDDITWEE